MPHLILGSTIHHLDLDTHKNFNFTNRINCLSSSLCVSWQVEPTAGLQTVDGVDVVLEYGANMSCFLYGVDFNISWNWLVLELIYISFNFHWTSFGPYFRLLVTDWNQLGPGTNLSEPFQDFSVHTHKHSRKQDPCTCITWRDLVDCCLVIRTLSQERETATNEQNLWSHLIFLGVIFVSQKVPLKMRATFLCSISRHANIVSG